MTTYLERKHIDAIHRVSLSAYGGIDGVREDGLIDSAIAQPSMTFSGQELYPTIFEKAAVLAVGLIMNHGFLDGNKRVGFAAMCIFLNLNNHALSVSADDATNLALSIAEGKMDTPAVSRWLSERALPIAG